MGVARKGDPKGGSSKERARFGPIGKMSKEKAILRGTIFVTGVKWNSEKGRFFS
jgi:hypothetical protein